jgi:hypothetical protein
MKRFVPRFMRKGVRRLDYNGEVELPVRNFRSRRYVCTDPGFDRSDGQIRPRNSPSWLGLAGLGLAWLGLAWLGLACLGLPCYG